MSLDEKINAHAFEYYPSLNKIRKHFESNYSQKISLTEAAAIVGLEQKHFGKLFHRKVGIGFREWITVMRIRKAMDVIRREHQPLVDVAFSVGFQDISTFERAFKKYVGCTPREFRRRVLLESNAREALIN